MPNQPRGFKSRPVDLVELDQEEDRDKEAIDSFMRKYAKLWQNIYRKYQNVGFKPKTLKNNGFDNFSSSKNEISQAEMIKLLRDHNTFP